MYNSIVSIEICFFLKVALFCHKVTKSDQLRLRSCPKQLVITFAPPSNLLLLLLSYKDSLTYDNLVGNTSPIYYTRLYAYIRLRVSFTIDQITKQI